METNVDEILISLAKKQIIIEKQEVAIQEILTRHNMLRESYEALEKKLIEKGIDNG